jgi:RNA polymerase sigma factor (sigma-70 family)
MSIAIYRRNIEGHCRFLSRQQELEAWRTGDTATLIKSQLAWVLTIAGRMAAQYKFYDIELLVSAGNFALIDCVKSFDATKARLTTYSARKIWWGMRSEMRRAQRGVSASRHIREKHNLQATRLYGDFVPHVPDDRVLLDDLIAGEEAGLLSEAIEQLPERQREVIRMRFYEGLKLSEAGERLGISKERARQIQSAAIVSLRNQLHAAGVE